ncbi:MAG: cellulase family glycosylhydrolase [Candidatus Obscuribacterales bacterium]
MTTTGGFETFTENHGKQSGCLQVDLANADSAKAIKSMKSKQPLPDEFGHFSLTNPSESTPAAHASIATVHSSLTDVLAQNDPIHRGQVTADTPFDWSKGKYGHSDKDVPAGVIGVGEWGVIYPELGRTPDPNVKIQVADAQMYYHKKGGGWVLAQSPDQAKWWEANYYRDFHGNLSTPGDAKLMTDGSYQFGAPPVGMNDHFGPGSPSLKFDRNLYDGVFSTMSVRSNCTDSGLVMELGADYYRPGGITQNEAGQTEASLSNPAVGGNNWTRITNDWQKLYFTSLDANTLINDPPPGILNQSVDQSPQALSLPTEATSDSTNGEHGCEPQAENSTHHQGTDSESACDNSPGQKASDCNTNAQPIDRNGDGQLNLEELLLSLLSADKDGNGILTSDELATFIDRLKALFALPAEPPPTGSDATTIDGSDTGGGNDSPASQSGNGDWTDGIAASGSDSSDLPFSSPEPSGNQLPSGNFTTRDGTIYDPEGKPFVAKGFAMYAWDQSNSNIQRATEQFKTNIIRLATSPDKQTPDEVQHVIDAYTKKGIVVEVEDHFDGTTQTGASLQKTADWYAQIAKANVNNPYVWFGTPNEQHVVNDDQQSWVKEQTTIYNAIRQTGNNNMIMLEQQFGGTGQALRNKKQTPDLATYQSMKNVAIDQHFYSGKPNAEAQLQKVLENATEIGLPVIVGEFGNTNGPRDLNDANSVAAVIRANERQNVGAIAWAWENPGGPVGPNGDGNAMYDKNGKITKYGAQIQSWIND